MTAVPSPSGARQGFALLVVLWFLVLLAALALYLVNAGRLDLALARNTVAAAEAEALAETALVRVAFILGDPRPSARWPADGVAHTLPLPGGEAIVSAEDEFGKVDPNRARPALLGSLFRELGADPVTADLIADAIYKRRSTAPTATPSAGPPAERGRPFETVDDLGTVKGMSAELLAAARPYLTVYSELDEPHPLRAPALVSAAIARSGGVPAGNTAAQVDLPLAVVRVTIRVRTDAGARFALAAVLRLDPSRAKGAGILWRERLGPTA